MVRMCGNRFVVGASAPEERAEARTTNVTGEGDHVAQGGVHVMGGEQKRTELLQFQKMRGRILAIVSPATDVSREVCPGYVIFQRSFIEGITAGAFK
jgi:hypothetical protein